MSFGGRRLGVLVEAALLALVGVGVFVDTLGYPPPLIEGVPGPAFFPRLLAVLLLAAAVILAARPTRESDTEPLGGGALRLAGAAGWIAGFLIALPWLGHLVALPPLVGGLMWLSGERSARHLIVISLLFGGFVHLLFVVTLGVPLP